MSIQMEDGWLRSGLGAAFPELVWAHGSANLYLSTFSTLSSGCGVGFLLVGGTYTQQYSRYTM